MMHPWKTREEYWGYLATFLHTTQTAPVRHSYLDLDALLKGKDFFILTTNQDTQFVKLYPEEKVAEIQGDHRFFQCAACCTDDTWDAVKPVLIWWPLWGMARRFPRISFPGVRTAVARLSPGCEDMGISCKERNTKNSTKKFLAMCWNTKTVRFCFWSWALAD